MFLVMFGGLHLEMGMWNMLCDYLACSGWTTALADSGVATSGTADSFLKSLGHVTHIQLPLLPCISFNSKHLIG